MDDKKTPPSKNTFKQSYRFKTDVKSTELSETFGQPELKHCAQQLSKFLKSEIYHKQLGRILNRLALQPSDLMPLSRHDIVQSSRLQIKQLVKEDVDFYVDNKCAKLQARRLALLEEVAKEYKQSEKTKTVVDNFMSYNPDLQLTKRNHRYDKIDISENMIKNERRRSDVLKRLRLQQQSDTTIRLKLKESLNRKFSLAQSRKRQYQSRSESMRSSPSISPQEHKKRHNDAQIQHNNKLQQLKEQLLVKLERASHSREVKRKSIEESLHLQNERHDRKVQVIKDHFQGSLSQINEHLRESIEEDMVKHIKKKEQFVQKHVRDLKIKKMREGRKIEAIKVELKRKEEQHNEKLLESLRERQDQAEKNKISMQQELVEAIKRKQRQRDRRINGIYRRKSQASLQSQQRKHELLRYRLETEALVSARKKEMEVQRRRRHIVEQIKFEISQMNIQRHHKMEELKIAKTKEELRSADQKAKVLEYNRDKMIANREKLKMLFRRRKSELDDLFYGYMRDVSRKEILSQTPAISGRSLQFKSLDVGSRTKEQSMEL